MVSSASFKPVAMRFGTRPAASPNSSANTSAFRVSPFASEAKIFCGISDCSTSCTLLAYTGSSRLRSDMLALLLSPSALTILPSAARVSAGISPPGLTSSAVATDSAAVSSEAARNTTTTRCRMRLAPPSRYRLCRLKMTAEIMNGSTIIFSRSTYTTPTRPSIFDGPGKAQPARPPATTQASTVRGLSAHFW